MFKGGNLSLDRLKELKEMKEKLSARHAETLSKSLSDSQLAEENARLNIRVNALLKQKFEELCKENHTSISAEIKRFMNRCVKSKSFK